MSQPTITADEAAELYGHREIVRKATVTDANPYEHHHTNNNQACHNRQCLGDGVE